jgi:hypothetical protein
MRRLALLALSSALALLALVVVPELPAQAQPLPEASPRWLSPNPALPSQVGLELVPVEGGLRVLGAEAALLPLPAQSWMDPGEQLNDGLHEVARRRFEVVGELAEVQAELSRRVRGGELLEEPGWSSLRQRRGELELELVLWQDGERVSGEWIVSLPSSQDEPPMSTPLRYALVDGGVHVACAGEERTLAVLPLPPGQVPEAATHQGERLIVELAVEQDCGELSLWAADRLVDEGSEPIADDLDLSWSQGGIDLFLTSHPSEGECRVQLEARTSCGW